MFVNIYVDTVGRELIPKLRAGGVEADVLDSSGRDQTLIIFFRNKIFALNLKNNYLFLQNRLPNMFLELNLGEFKRNQH